MPLVERHFDFDAKNVHVIDPASNVEKFITINGANFINEEITKENYHSILNKIFVNKNEGFCINLSVDTSSKDIIKYCQERNILYIDTVIEEWKGFYSNLSTDTSQITNYSLRENLLKYKNETKTYDII